MAPPQEPPQEGQFSDASADGASSSSSSSSSSMPPPPLLGSGNQQQGKQQGKKRKALFRNPSRVLLLKNMVGSGEGAEVSRNN